MNAALRLVSMAVLLAIVVSPVRSADLEAGRRLYQEGRLANGEMLHVTLAGGLDISGSQYACTACHRPSGFGMSEGGIYAPPIIGRLLYRERVYDRAENMHLRYGERQGPLYDANINSARTRPAFDDASLARLIREGVDSAGRKIDTVMPRYSLADGDMANLLAYLATLGKDDPGVDETTIRFAFVVAGDVDKGQLEAVARVVEAYVAWRNEDIIGYLSLPQTSPLHRDLMYQASRLWAIDFWTLRGPPATWGEQLNRYYDAAPVFALLGGIGQPWQPVHDFCEARQVACLFPLTTEPGSGAGHEFTLYFDRGLELEAEVIAAQLAARQAAGETPVVAQIAAAANGQRQAAEHLVERLRQHGIAAGDPVEVPPGESLAAIGREMAARRPAVTDLVVWPDYEAPVDLADFATAAARWYFPSYIVPEDGLGTAEQERLNIVWPYRPPADREPRSYWVRGWLRARGIPVTHPRRQFQTYFTLQVTRIALNVILKNYNRRYFIERIEHSAEGDLDVVFDNLSLGPGQRYAVRGARLATPDPAAEGGLRMVSEFFVPD